MVQNKPIRLNNEWVTSSNRHVFLVRLDNDICGYCKTREGAEDLIRSLGTNIEEELRKEKGNTATITKEIIEGENEVPSKVIIHEQALGYVYNSCAKPKHTLTYTSTYKCYYNPQEEVEEEEVQEEVEETEQVEEVQEVQEEIVEIEEEKEEPKEEESKASHIVIEIHDTVDSVEDVYSNEEDYEESDEDDSDETDSEEEEDGPQYDDDEYEFERKARRLIERFFSFLD